VPAAAAAAAAAAYVFPCVDNACASFFVSSIIFISFFHGVCRRSIAVSERPNRTRPAKS
ncbi:uncharacterized protein BDZ99DRAFT_464080, partial [Mytilinidion resinicola]